MPEYTLKYVDTLTSDLVITCDDVYLSGPVQFISSGYPMATVPWELVASVTGALGSSGAYTYTIDRTGILGSIVVRSDDDDLLNSYDDHFALIRSSTGLKAAARWGDIATIVRSTT